MAQYDEIGIGGAIVGGFAVTNFSYNYEATGGVVIGGPADTLVGYQFVSTGMSDDAPPDFAGVTVGYQNQINPTIVNYGFDVTIDLSWRVNTLLLKEFDLEWNTGQLRQYWYRIIGKGKQDVCPPVKVNDPCCYKYILNIHARSIDDLCQKLRDRQWKWPILSVQRFSKPAENSAVAEDEAAGIDHSCNVAETVEVCTNLLCADFCVDFDITETIGFIDKLQFQSFFEADGSDGVYMGGAADYSFTRTGVDYFYEPDTADVVVGGDAVTIPNHYAYAGSGDVVTGGEARTRSKSYHYVGGVWPFTTGTKVGTDTDQFQESPNDADWKVTERVFTSNDLWTIADLSFNHSSEFLVVKNFHLNIPTDMSILGIKVSIERHANNTNIRDDQVYLVVGDEIVSDTRAKIFVGWPLSDAVAVYGSNIDDWRSPLNPDYLGPWDIDDLNDPDFGVAIRVDPTVSSAGVFAFIDQISIEVFYEDPVHQNIRTGGSAGCRSNSYHYAGTGSVTVNQLASAPFRIGWRVVSTGRGPLGPEFSSFTVGGSIAMSLSYSGGDLGRILIGGTADYITNHYEYDATGGIQMAGEAAAKSPCWHYMAVGGIIVFNTIPISPPTTKASYYYKNPSGGVVLDGAAGFIPVFYYNASGNVVVGGEAGVVSSNFHWFANGGVSVDGGEDSFADFDALDINMGIVAFASDVVLLFGEDVDESDLTPPEDSIVECSCPGMPLSLPFFHNLIRNNKLDQFLKRNNLSAPSSSSLMFNRNNTSWQANFHYKGFSSDNVARESWDVLFELQCTDFVDGETIGRNIWKFAISVIQKNLTTYEDYDTKVIVSFVPDPVCLDTFKVRISLDTQNKTASTIPLTDIYQVILHDNIGLFKEPLWISNPMLDVSVSQSGLTTPNPRQVINV